MPHSSAGPLLTRNERAWPARNRSNSLFYLSRGMESTYVDKNVAISTILPFTGMLRGCACNSSNQFVLTFRFHAANATFKAVACRILNQGGRLCRGAHDTRLY